MIKYRVECNFGCRYFSDENYARRYFDRCKSKHLDCEIWIVFYISQSRELAVQVLLEHSQTSLPKY